jgi:cytoskeletal protein CcmA (bactofilin family)
MGKLLIIILLMLTAVFATIAVSVQSKSADIPDLISSNMSEIKAKGLSNEALMYSIRQLNEGNLSVSESSVSQTFSNFEVLDGTIDSIKYVMVGSGDTLKITSYVTANVNGKRTQYQSMAGILYTSASFDNAITCSKDLDIRGSSTIIGNVEENVDLDFETVFGMTMAQMRAIADNDYTNPPNNVTPVNGITYIETTGNNKAHFTNHHWSGSGILIVDGEFHMTGGTFDGIIWVEGGRFMMSGNGLVQGTIFINAEPDEQTKVTGNCDVYYDEDIVQQLLSTYNIFSGPGITIISWDN